MTKFTETNDLSRASIVAMYDRLLTKKLEQDCAITDLRKELAYKEGVINSLTTQNCKLKES